MLNQRVQGIKQQLPDENLTWIANDVLEKGSSLEKCLFIYSKSVVLFYVTMSNVK